MGGQQAGCIGLLSLLAVDCDIISTVAYDNNVKMLAEELKIPTFPSIHEKQFLDSVKEADLLFSVHGRQIVPKKILDIPSLGCVNVHPCLYKYKGANPIQRMLDDNNSKASIGIHYMVEDIDAGELIIEEFIDTMGRTVLEVYNELYPYYAKTIIKEWLFQLLEDRVVIKSPKSYNSQIGVPLSVWQMEESNNMAIFEGGISKPDEMEKLQSIIRPNIGILTNIGEAHNENFISTNQKIGEKLKLFTKVDTLIYCLDHSTIQEVLIRSAILETVKSFTWSRKLPADLQITSVLKTKLKSTTITGIYQEEEISIEIPFVDEASLENSIHCWAALLHMGMDMDFIAEGMKMLQPIAMRLEMKAGINHCTVINDSYNSDINSLSIAIDFLNQQSQHKKRTIVLSDILQSGKDAEELYSDIAGILKQKNIGRIIGIGPAISRQADLFEMEKTFYSSTEEFMRKFSFTSISNETILLKGARIFEFEQISKALQQKSHETVMEINLNAMVNNLNYFRSKISPLTRIMVMVKAFSYGSGGYEIANLLQFHRVDYLTVAYADEGVELRKAGIILPIMVMNPEEHSFDAMIQHNLEPEIYNFRILDVLEKAIRKNILPRNKPVKIHIKLETGMHRLGFESAELEKLSDRIRNNRRLYVQSVFSHLVASGEPESDEFTRGQIEKFKEMCDNFCGTIHHTVLRHMTNSAGITRFPEAHFDMVRLGVSLYGVASNSEDEGGLENVSTLKSTISQIKKVKAGERIGYGNMIIGNDITQYDVNKYRASIDGGLYRITIQERHKIRKSLKSGEIDSKVLVQNIWLDPDNFRIRKIDIKELGDDSKKLTVVYDKFIQVDGQLFPSKIHINIVSQKAIKININFIKMELNETLRFPFKVPRKYETMF